MYLRKNQVIELVVAQGQTYVFTARIKLASYDIQDLVSAHYNRLVGSKYLSLPPTRQDLKQGQRHESRVIVGIKGGGQSGTSRGSNPAGLCWSPVHLVQCEPDQRSWTDYFV